MNFTQSYAEAYDLLNEGKPYEDEVAFMLKIWSDVSGGLQNPNSVLDLGCGSGLHLSHFDNDVLKVGVDLSKPMLETAGKRSIPHARFVNSSIGDARLSEQFDLVYSLFHVLSYQTTEDELLAMFETISLHLAEEGVCVIDFWHRAAWDLDPPVTRITKRRNHETKVIRISSPSCDRLTGIVDIEMDVFVESTNSSANHFEHFTESHRMRAYTLSELSLAAKQSNLIVADSGAWMSREGQVQSSSWYGWLALTKTPSQQEQ